MKGAHGGRRRVYWDIAPDPTLLADVRSMVRRTLAAWGLSGGGDLVDDFVLALSELLGNAILHGLPPIRLAVRMQNEALYAEVTDHGAELHARPTTDAGHPPYGGAGFAGAGSPRRDAGGGGAGAGSSAVPATEHGAPSGRDGDTTADLAAGPDAEHGRGLAIVGALCDEWGVRAAAGGIGKCVWFRKACPRPNL